MGKLKHTANGKIKTYCELCFFDGHLFLRFSLVGQYIN